MISVVALHFLAGVVTGCIFAVRTLLTLVALVLMECVGVTIAWGVSMGLWSLGSLIAIQVGLPWRYLSSRWAGASGHRGTQRSAPPSPLAFNWIPVGL